MKSLSSKDADNIRRIHAWKMAEVANLDYEIRLAKEEVQAAKDEYNNLRASRSARVERLNDTASMAALAVKFGVTKSQIEKIIYYERHSRTRNTTPSTHQE